MSLNTEALSRAATEARGLAIDAVHACSSGHLGLPLGCAELGAVLYGHALSIDPADPSWINRDRFVLSAGHGSMFLYGWLHLSGFELPIDEVKAFRQMHSMTPGHPEFREAPGVESTTGPLGQGIGNAVGMAAADKMAQAMFNTDTYTILDSHVVCLMGDGCVQEGVAQEASAIAGHLGLDNLIAFYDANDVTLDAMADKTQSEDTGARYEAMGWQVTLLKDGHDMQAILDAFEAAKADDNGKPKLIMLKTEIGRGIPEVAGSAKAHGEGGAKFAEAARKGLGLPDERFFVSDETKSYFSELKKTRAAAHVEWKARYAAWKKANSEKAKMLEGAVAGKMPTPGELFEAIPEAGDEKVDATRGWMGVALNTVAARMPLLVSGSADLHGSTKNYLKDLGEFDRGNPTGRNFLFGIREHGMGALVNGFGYHGLFYASGATFLSFSDYMRGAVRLAALSKLHNAFIFTHDSPGVGEDGPTHQPIEQTSALRMIPNLDVIRPADSEETAGALVSAITRTDGPTAFILSRQKTPQLSSIPARDRREGVLRGGYIVQKETGSLDVIIIACGTELAIALEAAAIFEREKEEPSSLATKLGIMVSPGIRVVSIPSMEIFERQSADYKESILPSSCRKRVSVEAGVTTPWHKYVGIDGIAVGIDRFGLSAPGGDVLAELGITADAVALAVNRLVSAQ